jgi:MFS family permease
MIIGMGMVSGPFVGGLLAQNVGLRAPYVLCCVVLVAAMLLEYRLFRKKVRNDETTKRRKAQRAKRSAF